MPVYNKWELTGQCLASLADNPAGASFEVLVVDNGSTDATSAECPALGRALFGDGFKFLSPGENLNFGPGCNLGAENARSGNLFFLNNDTLATENWAGPLLDELAGGAGAAGPLLLFPDSQSVQHLGICFHVGFQAGHLHSHVPRGHPLARKTRELQAVTGAALMIPKALFFEAGGFYPGYANGCEDLELCCRVRQKGMSVTCQPESVIYHLAGASEGRYDREAENYRLLQSRAGGCFEPDFHALAAADGYELRPAENLDEYMAVPEERAAEHAARVGDFDEALCRDLLEKEIYWQEGYEMLAARLERAGAFEDALMVRYRQSLYTPTRDALLRLGALAGRLGLADAATAAAAGAEEMTRQAADKQRMAALARERVEFYRSAGEDRLAAMYEKRAG